MTGRRRRRRRGEEHVPRARNEKCRHFLSDVLCVSVRMRLPNGVTTKEGKNVYNFYYAQNAVALINFDALMISEKNP
jgi:hypothetical protein